MMSLTKRFFHALAKRVAHRVQNNDLFEKEGDRVAQEVIFPKPLPKDVSIEDVSEIEAVLQSSEWCFLHHWASWCDGCMEEIEEVKALADWLNTRHVQVTGVCWELFNGTPPQYAFPVVSHIHTHHQLPFKSIIIKNTPEELFERLAIAEELIPQVALYKAGEKIWEHIGVLTQTEIQKIKEYV